MHVCLMMNGNNGNGVMGEMCDYARGLVLVVVVLTAESPPVPSLQPSHHPTQEIFICAPDYVGIMLLTH